LGPLQKLLMHAWTSLSALIVKRGPIPPSGMALGTHFWRYALGTGYDSCNELRMTMSHVVVDMRRPRACRVLAPLPLLSLSPFSFTVHAAYDGNALCLALTTSLSNRKPGPVHMGYIHSCTTSFSTQQQSSRPNHLPSTLTPSLLCALLCTCTYLQGPWGRHSLAARCRARCTCVVHLGSPLPRCSLPSLLSSTTHTHMHTCIRICVHAYRPHMHACIRTYIHRRTQCRASSNCKPP